MATEFHLSTLPTANAAFDPARRVMEGGRSWLVAPLTSIVPGVLPGSKGPLHYAANVVARRAASWDGAPLTFGHPYDPLTNEHLSAAEPGVWERQGLGHLRNSRFEATLGSPGKLRHDGWFDEERVKALDRANGTDVHNRLLRGMPIEVSTGLFTKEAPAAANASHNGRPYTHSVTDYSRDHMAVLPNQVGACSNNDGCGVFNARTEEATVNQTLLRHAVSLLQAALSPTDNAQSRHAELGQFLNVRGSSPAQFQAAAERGHGSADFRGDHQPDDAEARAKLIGPGNAPGDDGRDVDTLTGQGPGVDADEQYPTALDFREKQGPAKPMPTPPKVIPRNVSQPTKNDLGEPAVDAYGSASPHDVSKAAAGASLMAEHDGATEHATAALAASKAGNAKKAGNLHVKAAEEHEGEATNLRRRGQPDAAAEHDAASAMHRKAASMHGATLNQETTTTRNEGIDMKGLEGLTKEQRAAKLTELRPAMLARLTANCGCSKEREGLQLLNNETLALLVTNGLPASPTANAEGNFAGTSGSGSVKAGGLEGPDKHTTADPDFKTSDRPDKDEFGNVKVTDGPVTKTVNSDTLAFNQERDWLAKAPSSIRRQFHDQKVELVRRLIVNVRGDDARQAQGLALMQKSTEYLQGILPLVIPAAPPATRNRMSDSYDAQLADLLGVGAEPLYLSGGQPTGNAAGGVSAEDDLPLPNTMAMIINEHKAELAAARNGKH